MAVDASVAVKWFADEVFTPRALALTNVVAQFVAPDLIPAEVASTLLKKARRNEFPRELVYPSLDLLTDRVATFSIAGLEHRAFDFADRHGCSLYDGLYMLIALDSGCELVTADRRLYNALSQAYPSSLLWIGDVPLDSQ
jgi:predicted nucleic acid-binding protein